jgi:uracil-DNA glycosylase family 4
VTNTRRAVHDDKQRAALALLNGRVESCTACPRLVEWRAETAANPRRSFAGEVYWGKPLRGIGDPSANLVLVGLAPAAHGGNRTGRMFTGDQSGDFLFAALHRAGFANQPLSKSRDDGLELTGAYITAAVRCAPPANRPTPEERDTCLPYLAEELSLVPGGVWLCLGAFAYDALQRVPAFGEAMARPRPRFGHAVEARVRRADRPGTVLCSFHPSQQNVFTGRLTSAMFDDVLARAKELVSSR